MDLKNNVVQVTGSRSGIGRETVKRFSANGCKVIVTCPQGKMQVRMS